MEEILVERMTRTFEEVNQLRQQGIPIAPYVEIGAERGQRSLVMENDLGVTGAAVDLSFDTLKSCDYYSRVFNKSKVPLRICCDAEKLPFKSNSVPFVFCYETLHHFPDPAPIVREIHRILHPGRLFFFAEEPYKKVFHLNLYKTKKIYSKDYLQIGIIRKTLDFFLHRNRLMKLITELSRIMTSQSRRGNAPWEIFDEKRVTLQSLRVLKTNLFEQNQYVRFILAYLFGGGISGLCCKSGELLEQKSSIRDLLSCPTCVDGSLKHNNQFLLCSQCGKSYPILDGVVFLLPYDKLQVLYPEVYQMFEEGLRHS